MSEGLMNQLQQSLVNIFSDTPLVTLEQNVDRALETITQQLQCDGVFVISANQGAIRPKARNLYLKPQFNKGYGARGWPLEKMPFFRSLIRQPKLLKVDDINQLPKSAHSEKVLLRQWNVKGLLVMPPVAFGQTRIAVGAVNCALGRGHELNRFRALLSDLTAALGDQALAAFDPIAVIKRFATAHNVDIEGLLKSAAQVEQDQANQLTNQIVDKAAGPVAGAVAGSIAGESIE